MAVTRMRFLRRRPCWLSAARGCGKGPKISPATLWRGFCLGTLPLRRVPRRDKLHGPGRYFLCRHCYRLAQASQSENVWDRLLRRANKIRHRLGGDAGMASPLRKPKGMWRRTYERLVEECHQAASILGVAKPTD